MAILDNTSPDLVIATLFAGARSFVLRDEPLDDLVRALRHTINGFGWITPTLFGSLTTYLLQLPIPRPLAELPTLTLRQKEVLELLVAGLSTTDIATRLGISTGTTKLHVSAVLQKLGVTCRASAVARATGRQVTQHDQAGL